MFDPGALRVLCIAASGSPMHSSSRRVYANFPIADLPELTPAHAGQAALVWQPACPTMVSYTGRIRRSRLTVTLSIPGNPQGSQMDRWTVSTSLPDRALPRKTKTVPRGFGHDSLVRQVDASRRGSSSRAR